MLKKKQTKAPAFQPTQSKSIAQSAKSELARLRKQINIEATLERVRSSAIPMRKSGQLTQVAKVMLIQLVELKAVKDLEDVHLAQILNYLKAYRIEVGLLINFGSKSLTFKRLVL